MTELNVDLYVLSNYLEYMNTYFHDSNRNT